MNYVKLAELVGKDFTVTEVKGYTWKKWDDKAKRMLQSDTYEQGFSRKYPVHTDRGILELGSGKLGEMLESAFKGGKSDLIGKTFSVKSNGKTGLEVRYYINVRRPVGGSEAAPEASKPATGTQQSLDEDPPASKYDEVPF